MLISFISWWYGKGWAWKAEKILSSLERSIDTFSLGLLIRTWFAPFRQIDAIGVENAPLNIRIRKFFDKLFSRVIGAFLRTIIMIIGVFFISIKAVFGILTLLIWPLVPFLPIIFMIIFLTGWTPAILPKIKSTFRKIPEINIKKGKTRGFNF